MSSIQDHFNISLTDKIVMSVHSALRSDQVLMNWTHENVHRCGLLMPLDEVRPPQIIVAPRFEEEEIGPNQVSEIHIPVGILLVWEENRRIATEGEPSIVSVINHVKERLLDREFYYLNIPPFNERLIRRLERFDPVDYGVIAETDNDLLMYLELSVVYRTDIHSRLRSKEC